MVFYHPNFRVHCCPLCIWAVCERCRNVGAFEDPTRTEHCHTKVCLALRDREGRQPRGLRVSDAPSIGPCCALGLRVTDAPFTGPCCALGAKGLRCHLHGALLCTGLVACFYISRLIDKEGPNALKNTLAQKAVPPLTLESLVLHS